MPLCKWKRWSALASATTDNTDLMWINPVIIILFIFLFLFSHSAWAPENLKTCVLLLCICCDLGEIRWETQPRFILLSWVNTTSADCCKFLASINLFSTELVGQLTFERISVVNCITGDGSRSYDTVVAVLTLGAPGYFLVRCSSVLGRVPICDFSMKRNIERCLVLFRWGRMHRFRWDS